MDLHCNFWCCDTNHRQNGIPRTYGYSWIIRVTRRAAKCSSVWFLITSTTVVEWIYIYIWKFINRLIEKHNSFSSTQTCFQVMLLWERSHVHPPNIEKILYLDSAPGHPRISSNFPCTNVDLSRKFYEYSSIFIPAMLLKIKHTIRPMAVIS